jgi:hypothetical protein
MKSGLCPLMKKNPVSSEGCVAQPLLQISMTATEYELLPSAILANISSLVCT